MRFLKNKRLIAGVIVVVGIIAAAMWPSSVEVGATRVTHGPMQVTIDEDGVTRIRDKFTVSAPVAGRLERIVLEPGDPVTGGKTLLARLTTAESPLLDPRTRGELNASVDAARAAVGQSQAERARANAELERARTTLQRQQELKKAGAIASDALDAAETAMRTAQEAARAAEFTVTRTQYELQVAQARLKAPPAAGRAIEIVAPVSGVILKRFHESETVVPVGDPLIEIGDPANIEIVADLLSTDAVRIPPGAEVQIDQWGGNQPLKGKVRRVEPAGFMKVSALGVEEQRVNVIIDFDDPASAGRRLGDAFRVEVRIVIWKDDNVVKVPVGALFRRGEAWAAFAVNSDRVKLQTVKLGQRNATEAQVTGGLSDGETIVLHPPDTLTDGARVRLRAE
ncbi:MAG TPA: efflux RND transporter periplasmic adaptor subunit [Vicinamibacterales bacterium]|nr:efflux RND transporter periplasmic adaptor subunit [Vicinamibacterales bacterium]